MLTDKDGANDQANVRIRSQWKHTSDHPTSKQMLVCRLFLLCAHKNHCLSPAHLPVEKGNVLLTSNACL